jgi:hypothetical protein
MFVVIGLCQESKQAVLFLGSVLVPSPGTWI